MLLFAVAQVVTVVIHLAIVHVPIQRNNAVQVHAVLTQSVR